MRTRKHVAVLGAGILGSCAALLLARKGMVVDLIDLEAAPMSGVSRWNEGKIHLGYLYGGDTSLATAEHLVPGGLAFAPLMQSLIEQSLEGHVTQSDDLFLIHRDSVVPPEQAQHYYHRVSNLIREHSRAADYLVDVRRARVESLSPGALAAIADPDIARAGYRIPERSVQTNWIADRLRAALDAQPGIRQHMKTRVRAVEPVSRPDGPWRVHGADYTGECDYVVNALWHGRIDVDCSAGLAPPDEWSNRYRLSLFVKTADTHGLSSAVLAVGPFGDIKNYNGRDFYLSWYPAGLVHESENSSPDLYPGDQLADERTTIAAIRRGLAGAFRGTEHILDNALETRLAGGYVFAQGRGSLSSAASTLHRRDRFGIVRRGRYFSIDTGKYSIAPWLAEKVACEIAGS